MITPNPPLTTAAPAYAPIRACEELVGNPRCQVNKFQQIAPSNPQKITKIVTVPTSIIPDPMVLATAVPNTKKAMKLKKAAQTTACFGDNTLVDTIVETELAASCMPFVKSNIKAMKITKIVNKITGSMITALFLSSHIVRLTKNKAGY
jgi:hypothetical protein